MTSYNFKSEQSYMIMTWKGSSILWYIAFGAIHEVSHVMAAFWIVLRASSPLPVSDLSLPHMGTFGFWSDLILSRRVSMAIHDQSMANQIHHAGWIVSLFMAFLVTFYHHYCRCGFAGRIEKSFDRSPSPMQLAAWLTAVEAMATDLLGMGRLWNGQDGSSSYVFWCGNFGVLLLHHLWFQDPSGRQAALDCLEHMIQITMMRGAQSGGVVTYQPNQNALQGIRCRVVNKKRTDLSQELRKRVQIPSNLPPNYYPFLSGHTRFATSSLSTLDGTHPHQWTPRTLRRIYNFNTGIFHDQMVEIFITHNGDLDFYQLNGNTYEVETILDWLSNVLGVEPPASVDSMCIAGLMDLLRCQGCFALSARYAIAMGLSTATMNTDVSFPTKSDWENIGAIFEDCWKSHIMLSKKNQHPHDVDSVTFRSEVAMAAAEALKQRPELVRPLYDCEALAEDIDNNTTDGPRTLPAFCMATIHAFLDHDLFRCVQLFLKHAKGSFGLTVSSSWDAHRRLVIAARGQPMSIGFYPDKGLICYGSEQAAVKAGLTAKFPKPDNNVGGPSSTTDEGNDIDKDATRLDLDDLGGEIVLLDWGRSHSTATTNGSTSSPPSTVDQIVSKPSRHLMVHSVMKGAVQVVISQESKSSSLDRELYHRLTRLTRNDLIKPLPQFSDDPIQTDIHDIPKVCRAIQDDFHSSKADSSMNRLTAFHLSMSLKTRLEGKLKGRYPSNSIDVLLTGCEVSLWLAEQFASDLQKCFPKLWVQSMSSNKILGMNGQEISIPTCGFPFSPQTTNFKDAIVIIVSHSGGTFAPLACSNLLQSATKNIFVVTGDWDTQIGKNLRLMNQMEEGGEHLLNHRIFSTGIGIRPAEPCSLSVVATHQLLTNLLQYMSIVILSDSRYRRGTGAVISAMDIQILERCNQMNIEALTEIVGVNSLGYKLDRRSKVRESLRQAADLWAEHILENVRAYIMCFIYIFLTVTSGWPIASAIARGSGLDVDNDWLYLVRAIDSAIYFWLPQICILLLRLWQGRNILHRMVGRTVVIGDIPWVAQSAEAFLSKIFAVSYSIAGVNVLSANPSDHLVHRHTHRVVRGTLAIFGRPDGRLSALSTAEASVCLAVNQASSIQSWGGTCESITLGHNPFKLDLSLNGIVLKRHRPLFLCERLLVETDAKQELHKDDKGQDANMGNPLWRKSAFQRMSDMFRFKTKHDLALAASVHRVADCSISLRINKRRSAPALLGAYLDFEEKSSAHKTSTVLEGDKDLSVDKVVMEAIRNRKHNDRLHHIFSQMDKDGDGVLNEIEFIQGLQSINKDISSNEARVMFRETDNDATGKVSYQEFTQFVHENGFDVSILKMPPNNRDSRGIIQIEPSKEKYFGEVVRKFNSGKRDKQEIDFELARHQHMAEELYETRIASMQRFVSMTVMFHHIGRRVENFFSAISFGFWGYRMDRTHSIMRIATTASPVSGADVRHRMEHWRLLNKVQQSVDVISSAYLSYKQRKQEDERTANYM